MWKSLHPFFQVLTLTAVAVSALGCQVARSVHSLPPTRETIPGITGWWGDPEQLDGAFFWLEPEDDAKGFTCITVRYPDEAETRSGAEVLSRDALITAATEVTVHPISRGYVVQLTPSDRAEEMFAGPHALNAALFQPLALHFHVEPVEEPYHRLTLRPLNGAWVTTEIEAGRVDGCVESSEYMLSALIYDSPSEFIAMFERAMKDETIAWCEPIELVRLSDEAVLKRWNKRLARDSTTPTRTNAD